MFSYIYSVFLGFAVHIILALRNKTKTYEMQVSVYHPIFLVLEYGLGYACNLNTIIIADFTLYLLIN